MAYSGGEEGIIVHNYWILKVDVIGKQSKIGS